jgi:hypothetical protein
VTQSAAGLGESRATALYWDKRYDTLPLARDASGELVETSPDILFVAANAVYRSGQRPDNDRLAIVSALDAAIAGYADVLRKVPGHIDAAYNYEYAVRARDAATRRRDTPRNQPRVSGATTDREHDLPAGPTIHGKPGAPPLDAENGKFRILVPMQPDERQDAPARTGEGGRPVRRG